jgi:hypothetical protein
MRQQVLVVNSVEALVERKVQAAEALRTPVKLIMDL